MFQSCLLLVIFFLKMLPDSRPLKSYLFSEQLPAADPQHPPHPRVGAAQAQEQVALLFFSGTPNSGTSGAPLLLRYNTFIFYVTVEDITYFTKQG
jgi:hypothetical protein